MKYFTINLSIKDYLTHNEILEDILYTVSNENLSFKFNDFEIMNFIQLSKAIMCNIKSMKIYNIPYIRIYKEFSIYQLNIEIKER